MTVEITLTVRVIATDISDGVSKIEAAINTAKGGMNPAYVVSIDKAKEAAKR